MKHNTEIILDESGIEVLVGYDYDISDSQIEEGHGMHEVGQLVYTELTSFEIIIKGIGIDILPKLTEGQKQFIIHNLDYT